MELKKPAVKIKQGNLVLYTTSFKVSDLLLNNFYQVDKLDSNDSTSGFQRVLDMNRAKKLAKYIIDAWEDQDAYLPTSIFLATDKKLKYDESKSELCIDLDSIGSFNVVDGQHRIKGLIHAAQEKPEIKDFEIIANIAEGLDEVSQMCHFLIVDTTQKAVDKSVEQQIIARLSSMIDLEDIPTLPKWIQKQVLKGEDKEALVIVNYLNNEPDSPWYQKIRMANEDKKESTTINQNSFVQSVKMYLLTSSNPLMAVSDVNKRNGILKNYWKAITELLVDDTEAETVVFKTIGVELFSIISATLFNRLFVNQDFRVETIKGILHGAMQNLPSDLLSLQDPDWWKSGGGASNINKGAARKFAHELNKAINSPANTSGNLLL